MNKDQWVEVIQLARDTGAFCDDRDDHMFNDEYEIIHTQTGLGLRVRLNWVNPTIAEYDGLAHFQACDPHHRRGDDAARILQIARNASNTAHTGRVYALKNHLEVFYHG